MKTGIAGHKIAGYAAINVKNIKHLRSAIALFGGIYVGVELPLTAQQQEAAGDKWFVTPEGLAGDGAPGSWGGHAIILTCFDSESFTAITWGAPQELSANWWWAYGSEAYAIISNDWIEKNGKSPGGFDIAALQQDLKFL
jgi:hypothetical protein